MTRPSVLVPGFLLLLASGCVQPQYGEAPFACARTLRCPSGYLCIDGLCLRGAPSNDVRGDAPSGDAGEPGDGGGADRGDGPAADRGDGGAADLGDPRLSPFSTPQPITALNDAEDDDNPSLTGDLKEIFFDSLRKVGGGHRPDTDLWTARRAASDAPWSAPTSLGELNTMQNELTPEVSADGLTLFFSSDRGGGTYPEIFVTTRASRSAPWETPTPVSALSSPKNDRSPTPAPDLLSLVLSSDRTGGAGGFDLYVSVRSTLTAVWGTPALIGELSTASAEQDPWADATGTLIYFSSTRAGGAGGHDLWRAVRPAPGATYAAPLPVTELNSAAYDGGCWLAPDGSLIVFASDRGGDRDLYWATR